MKTSLALIFVLMGLVMVNTGCAKFGTRAKKEDLERFSMSPNFNKEKGVFENSKSTLENPPKDSEDWVGAIKEWLFEGVDRSPKEKIPSVRPNLDEFTQASDELKVIWLGHSTFLLNFDGKTILVDPVFGKSVSPVGFIFRRFQEPPLRLEELPDIDIVLISHDHFDHLDMEAIKHFKNTDVRFVAPLGVGLHLSGWGIAEENIVEKDWWESFDLDGIRFTAAPAKHASGRIGSEVNETLWASWVIKGKKHNIYFSGDSGYDGHFKKIGDRYGPFDIAFMETGQYNEKWREKHLLPREAVVAYRDLRAKSYFPIHWAMFELAFHAWYDPIADIHELSKENNVRLLAPMLGEILILEEEKPVNEWWKPFLKNKLKNK